MPHRFVLAALLFAFACAPAPQAEHAVVETIAGLPAHVPAPEGAVSLYADFGAAEGNVVPLYFVNRSERAVVASGRGRRRRASTLQMV